MLTTVALVSCMMFTSAFAGTCKDGWVKFDKNCYYGYVYALYTYDEARIICVGMGGDLAIVDDADENMFLQQYTRGAYRIWIGLSDVAEEGKMVWVDNSEPSYTNWSNGEPSDTSGSENCVHIWENKDGQWNDSGCENLRGFVCEKPS
ncbi:C-type lectin domain family 4 member G-like [Ptychodera flava]|uniref:C-type lectin domain family 4 member G-like n=1 Tax=Ptychodera flava TaxID=63121 RepID=UPI00396A48A7